VLFLLTIARLDKIDFNLRVLLYVKDRFAGWRMASCELNLRQLFGRIYIGGVHTGSCVSCLVENGAWSLHDVA
jgi:hypothetical protein